jgi:hypothetical protein
MLMWVATSGVHTIANTPTGWTSLGTVDGGTDVTASAFRRVASSEPASYTFNDPGNLLNATDNGTISILAYSGVDNGSPINQSDLIGRTGVSTVTSASVTPSVDRCMIVYLLGQDPPGGGSTLTPDASPVATERVQVYNGAASGVFAQDYLQTSAAAISLDATCTATDDFAVFIVALTPA